MQIIYLNQNTDESKLVIDLCSTKSQNNYGNMLMFKEKIELVTTEPITDYRVFTSEAGKVFLCLKSSQLSNAIKAITDKISQSDGKEFRDLKEMLYIRMTPDQQIKLVKNQKLQVAIHVYGVFYQTSTKISFLQMEVSDFKCTPLIDFDVIPQ
jgi:hypothetical protein